jgi:aminopeptidase N
LNRDPFSAGRARRPPRIGRLTLGTLAVALGSTVGSAPLAAQESAALTAPGVSLDLARHRAATLSDVHYDAAFRIPADPDADVTGTVTISFQRAGAGPVILDFADPAGVRAVRVGGRAIDPESSHDHLVIPAAVLPAGRGTVTIDFVAADAPLNRRDDFLYTLFVPDRAHEAMPSFDQPDLKGRFRLQLTVPAEWTAVANGAVEARERRGDEVVYQFAETEPLPTYLFAFAAGEFQVEEAERDGRRLRLIHRETEAEKVVRNRDAIFDLHATALAWLEDYTAIPYPFGKFDLVAIPSFQYNGMEHPGAILYRASSLFLDESATRNQELGRASVIAHETAHMWFGDLVTMRWFDDVWMKEVFANFMAAKIVNPSFPDLDHELRFLLAHYPAAYGVDRTAGANPIRQPLDNLDHAGSLYGAIIYQKAPIVMRQLERLTGEEPFRVALRSYLDAHRFGNAGWPALVEQLDRVTDLDVGAWSRVWVEEPGRPVIDLDVQRAGAAPRIALRPRDPAGRGRVWPQRTVVAALDSGAVEPPRGLASMAAPAVPPPLSTEPVTLAGEAVTLPAAPGTDVVLPNADGVGYGLFRLDPRSRQRLVEGLEELPDALHRAVAWLDLWEMMLEGEVEPVALMETGLRVVARESDELVAQQVLGDLTELFWRYLDPDTRLASAARLEGLLWNRVEAADGASAKAAYFNAWRSTATTPAAVQRMREVWSGERVIDGLPLSERDRTELALQLAVRDVKDAEGLLDRQESDIDNADRRERFAFVRRAASPDPAVRRRFFASLSDRANRAREEWVVSALSLFHHPLRVDASLEHVRPALDLLLEVRATGDIFFPTRWLAATLGGHSSAAAATVVRDFIDSHPDYPPRLMAKLLQEADPLFRAQALRQP